MQEKFDLLVENYKKLPLEYKREKLIYEMKEMIALYVKIASEYNIPINLLKSKEILDLNNDNYTEEDYIEALYVYFYVLKEIISGILHNNLNVE